MITSYELSFTANFRTADAGMAGKAVIIHSTIIPRVGEHIEYYGIVFDVQEVIYSIENDRLDKIYVRVI